MLENAEAEVALAIAGAMIDECEPTVERRNFLRGIRLADDVVLVFGRYLFGVEIQNVAQQRAEFGVVLLVDESIEIDRRRQGHKAGVECVDRMRLRGWRSTSAVERVADRDSPFG